MHRKYLGLGLGLSLALAGCVSADPAVVAQAVNATLTAVVTPTPIVVVVTVAGSPNRAIPTTTPARPTPTPAPTNTATPTPAPTETLAATATLLEPTATYTPGPAGNLVFEDDFAQPGKWDLGQPDGTAAKVIANGWLSMTMKLADRYVVLYKAQSVPNVYMQATVFVPDCHTRDRSGLLFRVNDGQNYYQYDVDCDGRFRLAKITDETLTPLVDWTANAALHTGSGAVNELSVRAIGSQLAVSANGLLLARATDSTFALGGFGFSVGSGLTVPYTAAFKQLRVWEVSP